jgi:hypothetical protein
MRRKKSKPKSEARHTASVPASASGKRRGSLHSPSSPPPTVSGRWLLTAAGLSLLGAAVCAWGALCLLFWQGSWQLLYHPTAAVTRTPASVGLPFDPVGFAATEAGEPRLKGWWIPAAPDARYSRYTLLYLHGQNGNLSDTVEAVAALHGAGLNVFAFDYRGYGQSQFARPSEAHWREDAEWALQYLTSTRHVAAGAIVLDGNGLGANLALEVAAAHPELAGVVLESPLESPVDAIFDDPRAHLVPARWLVRDRFDADKAAAGLHVPSLWSIAQPDLKTSADKVNPPAGFDRVASPKMFVRLVPTGENKHEFTSAYSRWLDDLPAK